MVFDEIKFKWVGYRKSKNGRGSICGWFIRNLPMVPGLEWLTPSHPMLFRPQWDVPTKHHLCYSFRGHPGQNIHFEQHYYTIEFIKKMEDKQANFKELPMEKINSRLGKAFMDEFGMFIMMRKLQDWE